jgi:hypothetical protein
MLLAQEEMNYLEGACNIKDTKNITYSEICELIDEDEILEIFPDSFQDDEE